jgi:peptidoglycan-associated lipoprotein
MNFKKLLSLAAALVLVAACESSSSNTGATTGTGLGNQSSMNSAPRPGSQEDLAVNVGDRVFFGYNRSDLSPEARSTLDRQAAWLKQYGQVTITIEGHCDERGTREYNIGLGNRRAIAVKNYLVALGVNPARLATISYGKERPSVLGASEAAWAQNRRGVTAVN